MPLSLGVGEVVALVVVKREAELALVASEVVAHKIGILGQVDSFQRQPPQPLSTVDGLILCRRRPTAPGLRAPVTIHFWCRRCCGCSTSRRRSLGA